MEQIRDNNKVYPVWVKKTVISQEKLYENEFKSISKISKNPYLTDHTFHQAVYPVIVLAQIFALMPVTGISGLKASDLKFKFINILVFYSIFIFTTELIMALLTINWLLKNALEFGKFSALMFYGSNLTCVYLFGLLAQKWPALMIYWEEIELKMPKNMSVKQKAFLSKRIKFLLTFVMTLSLIEHALSIAAGIYRAYRCVGIKSSLEGYFKQSFPQLFFATDYDLIKAFCAQVINLYCTFSWNFMDLFIIIISVGLSKRFNQINISMNSMRGQKGTEKFWAVHRMHYHNLCDLLASVDTCLERLILLSFSNNLYFICIQLLNSLKPSDSLVSAIYFWYSLIFLIGRTSAVCLFSSKINDESRKPIVILQSIPTIGFNSEVRRFLTQVTNENIALSGKKFFHITRKLILQIAGTIVTYELVLVQFNVEDEKVSDNNPCT